MLAFLLCAAMGSTTPAGQPEPKSEPPKKQIGTRTPEHTEFPELRVPKAEDVTKLTAQLKANYPKPIPANGPPLEKVRTAQVNEGVAAIILTQVFIETGAYRPEEFGTFVNLINATFKVEAELVATPAAKIAAAENRIRLMNMMEDFTRRRVESGTDPTRNLHLARFARLQAEADLLLLKEQLKKEK